MGPVRAVFKADGAETQGRYSISEWWLEPHTRGPGEHTHEEDDVFFVIAGTMSFFIGGTWIDAPRGSFVVAPGGTPHDFENRTDEPAGALNISVPGDFEPHMQGIAEWFRARSPADSRTTSTGYTRPMSDPADGDPVEQTLEEAALARARAHLAELDAEAALGDENPPASPPPAPAQTREEADAEARAEFERLRDRSSKKTL
jgi:mannose-6-phosphate isomerase-like protein (cupin superfamily)